MGPFKSQEKLKTLLMQNFGVTSKEHYGMLWYFLEWSIASLCYGYESSFLYFFMFLFTVILRWFIWYLHVMIEIYTWSCKTDHFFLVQGLNWRPVSSAGRDRGFKPRPGQRPGSLKNWKHHVGCDLNLLSVQVIAIFGVDMKPLALSPSVVKFKGDVKEPTILFGGPLIEV